MTYNPYDGVNDDLLDRNMRGYVETISVHTPINLRPSLSSGLSLDDTGASATSHTAPEQSRLACAPPAQGAPVAPDPLAVTQTAPTQDGAVSPAAPSTPDDWRRRVLRALLTDCRDRHSTRYGVLSNAEVEALEDTIAASLGWTRTLDH